jgi:hypothetical protein
MSDEYRDPSGNTEAFRAFVQRDEPAPASGGRLPPSLIIGAIAAVLVIVVLVLIFLVA